jgi:hypothetical protein
MFAQASQQHCTGPQRLTYTSNEVTGHEDTGAFAETYGTLAPIWCIRRLCAEPHTVPVNGVSERMSSRCYSHLDQSCIFSELREAIAANLERRHVVLAHPQVARSLDVSILNPFTPS